MKYKIKKNLAYRNIEGKVYIVDSKNSLLHSLDEMGTFIWKLLQKYVEIDFITEKIVSEYEIDYFTAKKDTQEFLDKLEKNALVEKL